MARLKLIFEILENLSPGKYVLQVRGAGSHGIYLTNINLRPRHKAVVKANLPSRETTVKLHINTEPVGANIFIDDKLIATTPTADIKLLSGAHNIRVSKTGYEPYINKLNFEMNQSYNLDINLTPELVPSE